MRDLKYSKKISSIKEVTAKELKLGDDNDGSLYLTSGDLTVVFEFAFAGGYAYMASIYKGKERVDYIEDSKIRVVKKVAKEKLEKLLSS